MKHPPAPTMEAYLAAVTAYAKLHPQFRISIPTPEFLVMISCMQLALRHPAIPDQTRELITKRIKKIRDHIGEPIIMRAIDCSFDPAYDTNEAGEQRPEDP